MHFTKDEQGVIDGLLTMTDDTGIFQHSVYGVPDPKKGYTTDDNGRALILAVMLLERFGKKQHERLVCRFLSFLLNAQNEDGSFKNFMNYDREFIEEKGSEDCLGRCIWALGRTIASAAVAENIKKTCRHLLNKAFAQLPGLISIRAKAYAIVGLSFLPETDKARYWINDFSADLIEKYIHNVDGDWHWFENSLTYGNAFLPWALHRAYKILKNEKLLKTAKESMEFMEKITMKESYFKPIGCNGWFVKGGMPAEYDEQPLEACETLLLYLDYYDSTKEMKYLKNAVKCFSWYKGKNSKGMSLIDEQTGGCYDGLTPNGPNLNQGSESIISYGIALLAISKKTKVLKTF